MFGAMSSPSCCNYVLQKTAVDNGKKNHPDVATTSQHNFYADDFLKLVKDIQTSIRLLFDIISMCASGGFKLTKIISNRVVVLHSVTETKRRKNGCLQ